MLNDKRIQIRKEHTMTRTLDLLRLAALTLVVCGLAQCTLSADTSTHAPTQTQLQAAEEAISIAAREATIDRRVWRPCRIKWYLVVGQDSTMLITQGATKAVDSLGITVALTQVGSGQESYGCTQYIPRDDVIDAYYTDSSPWTPIWEE
jgi:hypothetical protein